MTEILAEVMRRLDVRAVIGRNEEVDGYNTVFGRNVYANGVIITELSLSMLGNLANGCGGEDEQFILSMLADGKEILIKEDGIEYRRKRNTIPGVLCRMYAEYEKKLYSYGMNPVGGDGGVSGKKLICLSDVEGLSLLHIGKGCIISPLAQDYIKENGIVLIKKE